MSPELLTIGQTIRKYLEEVLVDKAGTEPGDFDVWKVGQFSESGADALPPGFIAIDALSIGINIRPDNRLIQSGEHEASAIELTKGEAGFTGRLVILLQDADLVLFNPTMETKGAPVGAGQEFTVKPGERLAILSKKPSVDDQFYVADAAGLTRETVRPWWRMSEGDEDFNDSIIMGKTRSGQWIGDNFSNEEKIWINKQDGVLKVDNVVDNVVVNRGKPVEMPFGNQKIYFLHNQDGSVELISEAVWNARQPAKSAEAPAGETKKWNKPPSEWFAGVGKDLRKFWEQGVKPRGFKDVVSLIARAISDSGTPYAWFAGALLMGSNLALTGMKELKTFADLGDWQNAEKLRDVVKLYVKQTSFGRLISGSTKTGLTEKERNWALALGIGSSALFMGLTELTSKVVAGGSLWKSLLYRAFLGYVIPETFAYVGKSKIADEAKAKEWLGLTLGAMSTTITAASAIMFLGEGAIGLTQLISQRIAEVQAAETTPTLIPSAVPSIVPTGTAGQTHTEAPPTATPIPATETLPPTETTIPTLESLWQPGQAVDKTLLQDAADQNLGWGIDTDGDGNTDFQVFWLDQDQAPDVIRDVDNNQFIRGDNDLFFLDANKDGLIDGNEQFGAWKLEQLNPALTALNSNSDGLIEINANDIAKAGKVPGLAAPISAKELNGPVPPNIDLNKDEIMDILTDAKGQFADNDHNGVFNPETDTRIVGEIDFDIGFWQINKIVYADGSMWTRNGNGELVGVLSDGRTIRLDDSSGTSRLQKQMHQENLAWSPQFVGEQAVINPNNLPIPPAPVPLPPPSDTTPEIVTEPVRGDSATMIKANGDRVWLDAEHGGIHGVVQAELHQNYSDLSPEQVTVTAHRLIVANKDDIEAFHTPVGNGDAVKAAMNDSNFQAAQVLYQVNIVRIEDWLTAHADWIEREFGARLSGNERLAIGKFLARAWVNDWDDEDKKTFLKDYRQTINQIEQEFPHE